MSRRKPRGLRPEERALWDAYRQHAQPLPKGEKTPAAQPLIPPEPKDKQAPQPSEPRAPIPAFRIGEAAGKPARHDFLTSAAPEWRNTPVAMDRKAFARMKRGRSEPEARLDLHGLGLEEAHRALGRFILASASRDQRLVLVITGKGRRGDDHGPIPERPGVLRRQVPVWLTEGPVGGLVLQVSPAHPRHGGGGAYYVYLRRRK